MWTPTVGSPLQAVCASGSASTAVLASAREMKRAAAGDQQGGGGSGSKRRSVDAAGSDVEITPQHLVDTQLESLLGTAAKGGPSRSRTKASLKAIESLLAAVAPHEATPADHPQAGVHDPAAVLAWHAPAAVQLCGSFAQAATISAATVPGHTPSVDVAVQMPRACFLAKDYLNHKYSDKRALYLAVMLRTLRASPMFASAQLDCASPARPILTVPASADTPHLRIIPHVGEDGLAKAKLLPSRNNNRAGAAEGASLPTPRYNNRVLADVLMLRVAKDTEATVTSNPVLAKAMVLAKVWLMQRHLHKSPGGVSPFQLCLIMCYLQHTATINSEMTPWQMIRATLLYLSHARGVELQSAAAHPLRVTGAVISNTAPLDDMAMYLAAFDVVLLDSSGQLNVMASVSASGFAELVWHARVSMRVAGSAEPHELLSKLFFHQLIPACMFDIRTVVTLRRPSVLPAELEAGLRESSWEELVQQHSEAVVTRALGDRAALVRTLSADVIDAGTPAGGGTLRWVVGCKINANKAERTVDKGPPVEDTEAAAEFKSFWGSKSEVRRMKDGAIVQAVVWSNCTALTRRHHVIECILSHVLREQLVGIADPELHIEVADGQPLDRIIFRKHHSEARWKQAFDAFERLAKKIRNSRGDGDEGLPLAIVRVVPTSARLRRCSALPPRQHALIPGCTLPRDEAEPSIVVRPMGVVIEFEGSGTWPSDDMMALRAIKTAMLLRLAETLKQKFGISSQPTRNHLDVFVDGFAFRVTISHGREMSLIQEDITTLERAEAANEAQKPYLLARVPRGLTPAVLPVLRKELAAVQLAGHFAPLHSSTVNAVMLKHSAVARSVRLAKCWCHTHMFSGHLPPQLIELLVIYCFTERGASPHGVPATHVQGFARFLQLLFQYDWEGAPLVVDVDDAGDAIKSAAVESAWSKRQQNTTAMFVITNYDVKSVWTQDHPSAQVLSKIKSFARASAATLFEYLECRHGKRKQKPAASLKSLFQTPTNRFDLLIHLQDEVIPASADALNQSHKKAVAAIHAGPLALPAQRAKNLQLADDFEKQLLSGFSPPLRYVTELRVRETIVFVLSGWLCLSLGG
jgi:U3 small nucleolar RNA-associated protein 22